MLAIIAMVIFIVALFKGSVLTVSTVTLGLCFLAAHFAFTWGWPAWRDRRPPR